MYLLSCKVCGVQYVGSTSTRFRLRFNNHKSRIRAHARLSLDDKSRDDLIYQHLNGQAHKGIEDLDIQLIDQTNDERDLLDREGQWAYRLKCVKPHGLNESDFFFSQNKSSRVKNLVSGRYLLLCIHACIIPKTRAGFCFYGARGLFPLYVQFVILNMACYAFNGYSP